MTSANRNNIENATASLLETAYEDALELMSRAADYIESARADEFSELPTAAGPAYSVESTRLTTRLMQAMAWLLLHRAIRNGELPREEAEKPENRLGAKTVCLGGPTRGAGLLPHAFQLLLAKSENLYRRIERLDAHLDIAPANPVHDMVSRLSAGD